MARLNPAWTVCSHVARSWRAPLSVRRSRRTGSTSSRWCPVGVAGPSRWTLRTPAGPRPAASPKPPRRCHHGRQWRRRERRLAARHVHGGYERRPRRDVLTRTRSVSGLAPDPVATATVVVTPSGPQLPRPSTSRTAIQFPPPSVSVIFAWWPRVAPRESGCLVRATSVVPGLV